jgi:hypothetical protein
MANAYTPPEGAAAQKRAEAKKLTTAGVIVGGLGLAGIVVSTVLNLLFLGIIGGPLGSLSWLAVLGGGGLFVYGYLQMKSVHETRA